MTFQKHPIYSFIKKLFVVFIIYQITRLLFYFFNWNLLEKVTLNEIIGGIRFDLATIGYINIIFALLYLFPSKKIKNKNYLKTVNFCFYLVNLIFVATNFIDFEYYKFTNRRSTYSLISATGMENEIFGLLTSFVIDYWYVPLSFVTIAILFWFALPKTKNIELYKSSYANLTVMLLALLTLFLMGRGLDKKPLRIVDANLYSKTNNTALVLNTPFSILKTLNNKEKLENYAFYPEVNLNQIFNPVQTFTRTKTNKKNVVILILESFGEENLNIGQTPFLDSLATESLRFENAFANGRVSIDAVPSIISSIPSLMNNSLIASSFSVNKIKALPEVLKENGYSTSFFHGAFNGSQNFDQYCKIAGFEKYYGKNEYVGPESFDGKWGVFDEDFLQFFANEIATFKTPFFTTLFTISSHAPFTIPEKYKNKFPKGTNEIHETIAYTDHALKLFFEKAKNQSWYNNTLFIITADHTSAANKKPEYNNTVGQFKVPILFFEPANKELKGINDKNLQQIDIYPSIIDYLQLDAEFISYGKSYKSEQDFVVNYANNSYNYYNGDYYLIFNGKESTGLYKFKEDLLLKNNLLVKEKELKKQMESFIKAYIQSFNYRMNNNKLTIDKELNIENKIAKK